jgi:hypothetical protein
MTARRPKTAKPRRGSLPTGKHAATNVGYGRLTFKLGEIHMITARIPALALAMLLASASLAAAQEPPAAPTPMAHQGWDPAQMRQRMEERRAARLKALHDVLGIRPDQEAAFSAYAAAIRPPERAPGQRPGRMGGDRGALANLTTPQRLDQMAQRMEERSARWHEAFQRRAAATKALYASLNPEQQRAMDALPLLRGGHGRGGRGGWGQGRGMGGRGWGGHGGRGMDGHGPVGQGDG